jgi:hypothetical protein
MKNVDLYSNVLFYYVKLSCDEWQWRETINLSILNEQDWQRSTDMKIRLDLASFLIIWTNLMDYHDSKRILTQAAW